jgi:hypothetical protein
MAIQAPGPETCARPTDMIVGCMHGRCQEAAVSRYFSPPLLEQVDVFMRRREAALRGM